jgi:hypothetical protein
MPQLPAFPEIPAPEPVGSVPMGDSKSFAEVQLDIPITDGPFKANWASIEQNYPGDPNLCPTAELPLKVETSGVKHIAICGTGHPSDMKSFRTLTPKSFRGKAVIIIHPQDGEGEVTIKVTSPNLTSAEYKLHITQ